MTQEIEGLRQAVAGTAAQAEEIKKRLRALEDHTVRNGEFRDILTRVRKLEYSRDMDSEGWEMDREDDAPDAITECVPLRILREAAIRAVIDFPRVRGDRSTACERLSAEELLTARLNYLQVTCQHASERKNLTRQDAATLLRIVGILVQLRV